MYIFKLHEKFFSFFRRKPSHDGVVFANFVSRYTGIIVDLLIMYIIIKVVPIMFLPFSKLFMPSLETVERYKLGMEMHAGEMGKIHSYIFAMYAMRAAELVLMYVFCVTCWTKLGGSPAKLIMGLRMVDKDTLRFISFRQANKRFLSYPLSLLPIGAGILWGILDKKGQMLHDKLSGTVVVYKEYSNESRDIFDRLAGRYINNFTKITGKVRSKLSSLVGSTKA